MTDTHEPYIGYHVVAFLDILGQSQKLQRVQRVPTSSEDQRRFVKELAAIAIQVRLLREVFDSHFKESDYTSAEERLPEEHRAAFRAAFSVSP